MGRLSWSAVSTLSIQALGANCEKDIHGLVGLILVGQVLNERWSSTEKGFWKIVSTTYELPHLSRKDSKTQTNKQTDKEAANLRNLKICVISLKIPTPHALNSGSLSLWTQHSQVTPNCFWRISAEMCLAHFIFSFVRSQDRTRNICLLSGSWEGQIGFLSRHPLYVSWKKKPSFCLNSVLPHYTLSHRPPVLFSIKYIYDIPFSLKWESRKITLFICVTAAMNIVRFNASVV